MIFKDFDFKLLDSPEFKEDSVREEIILPILKSLGYSSTSIVRSKTLTHPFLTTGATKRKITLVPDYLLKIEESYAWVLDAKSPKESVIIADNVQQVYSYAIHPEIRTKFFALCNGKEFALYRTEESKPRLFFEIKAIADYWEELKNLLSPDSFLSGHSFQYTSVKKAERKNKNLSYLDRPLLEAIQVRKRAAKRHFGVHGYFTKQAWNVVQEYIKNFSEEGDVVLDPFGGSGVTAIEALMTGRKAIHIDINPMSVFIVDALLTPANVGQISSAFERIKVQYEKSKVSKFLSLSKNEQLEILNKYKYPKSIPLPKGSDVTTIEQLFSNQQLADLGFLKSLIKKEQNKSVKKALLLAFSSLLNKINLTYHNSTYADINAGDSSVMRYYRYRIAPSAVNLDFMKTYEKKVSAVINAKTEMELRANEESFKEAQIIKGTATDLSFLKNESVDYIYTDPPYGKKIPYLDLSTMWNAWLDLEVTEQDFELEAIEGGEHNKSKDEYNELIAKSIEEMYRVLKFDRWMSFVFAHKDPEFWHLILETAERCGFEYAGAVAQKNGQTSFKKRQNPFTVLSGQLIINFKKVRKPKAMLKANLGQKIGDLVMFTIESLIAIKSGATLEQINDELIIKGLEMGFLDLLKKEYSDLTPLLMDNFDYDEKTELFSIKKNKQFKTHVRLDLRINYYLKSYFVRTEKASFDDIVQHIMPLLKNGITPENQTILNVLEVIAEKEVKTNMWKLKPKDPQGNLSF